MGRFWIGVQRAGKVLQPAADGSYLQPVELVEYRGDRAQSFVSLRRSGNEKQWKYPDILGAYRADVDVSAEAVRDEALTRAIEGRRRRVVDR